MIDARGLHGWLEVKDPFSQWLKRRVTEYGFDTPSDFISHEPVKKAGPGRRRRDYLLTVDMAKELSMIERTDKGRAARRYFIAMEKAAMQMASDHIANGTQEAIPQGFWGKIPGKGRTISAASELGPTTFDQF